ncbi:MAG: hypothetical protein HY873_12965 [Chloroflexi bacterium]|nr:hypothetical protein [Chloroflexota bacterium]
MLKVIGLGALAAVAALVLGFGARGATPTSAVTTNLTLVNCVLLAPYVDDDAGGPREAGNSNDATSLDDIAIACNRSFVAADWALIAGSDLDAGEDPLGDGDGVLEASDLDAIKDLDANQLDERCTGAIDPTDVTFPAANMCNYIAFAFVDDEGTISFDATEGLQVDDLDALVANTTNYDCDTTAEDPDCNNVPASDGDGLAYARVFIGPTSSSARGDSEEVTITQEAVDQTDSILTVGAPNDVKLTLTESLIETNSDQSGVDDCVADTDVRDAIAPPNSTLAYAVAVDQDDTELTMVPVTITVQPPGDDQALAALGEGDPVNDIVGDTGVTVDPGDGLPIGHYRVVCGGRGTGETTIRAQIDSDGDFAADDDQDNQDLTIGGPPAAVALTAQASTIKCDGSEKSTVTAKVTDSDGNNVADGVPVNFSVVALGTADPINTVTKDGQASSVVTPLSNSSAGVTVIVTAGSSSIASPVQVSVRVDCALPLVTQPTLGPAVPTGPITPPDTGNGGYLGQDGASFPMWTLIALALGSMVLVAGGVVARNSAK